MSLSVSQALVAPTPDLHVATSHRVCAGLSSSPSPQRLSPVVKVITPPHFCAAR